MPLPSPGWLAAATCAVLFIGLDCAHALPMSAHEPRTESIEPARTDDSTILSPGPALFDAGPLDPTGVGMGNALQLDGSRDLGAPYMGPDADATVQRGASSALLDALRPFIQFNPNAPGAAPARNRTAREPMRRADGQPPAAFNADVQEWIDESVRGLVASAIDLRVDGQGRASFAVLGMGDFGLTVSGDRSAVALVSGTDVLFSAYREPFPQPGGVGPGEPLHFPRNAAPAAVRSITDADESPLKQAMRIVADIATHPISLLVYVIVAAYFVLWNILRRPRSRRRRWAARLERASEVRSHRRSRRRRSRRSHRSS